MRFELNTRSMIAVLFAVLMAAPAAMPVAAAAGNDSPWSTNPSTSNLPDGCTASFSDGCYHMRGELNALDSPQIDVMLVVPASPYAERDLRAMEQSIYMFEDGFQYIAEQEGYDWLAEGVDFHVTPVTINQDGEFSTYPVVDPEIVVFRGNPFAIPSPFGLGGFILGIGIDPLVEGPCHGVGNVFDIEEWENLPGFNSHHDGRSGTFTEDCNGRGGNVCFAVNGGLEPLPDTDLFGINVYDLVSHEVGHCLRLGHVGDPGTEFNAAAAPLDDIMSYDWDNVRKCVSSLDTEVFATAMSKYLDVNGDGAVTAADQRWPNDHLGEGGNRFQVQHPDDHYYASSTGLAKDCPQPNLDFTDVGAIRTSFYPEGGTGAEVTITSHADGATVDVGTVTVSGTAEITDGSGSTGPVISDSTTDAAGDSTSPFADVLAASATLTATDLLVEVQVAMMDPGTDLQTAHSISAVVNGHSFDSFAYLGTDTWNAGAGEYMPVGGSSWDSETNTVSFQLPLSYLASANNLHAPFDVHTTGNIGGVGPNRVDDRAPEQGEDFFIGQPNGVDKIVLSVQETGESHDLDIVDDAFSGQVTLANAGTYNVRATWKDGAGTTLASDKVTLTAQGGTNVAPTADAGTDTSAQEGSNVQLDGTGSSDSDGTIASYTWTQSSGPTVTLNGDDTATPSFTAPNVDADTTLTFDLTVTDDGGATDTDSVTVTVKDTVPPPTGTTLYLGSTGPTFVGTADQLVFIQPLNEEAPPAQGASIALDPNNGWSTATSPLGIGGPNWVVDLVWQSEASYSLVNQEVTVTLWAEKLVGLCDGAVQSALWVDDATDGWTQIATTQTTLSGFGMFEFTSSFGTIAAAEGPLALSINTPFFDCNADTTIYYDDAGFTSRIEILQPIVTNNPPTADAGDDISVDEEGSASLDGTGSSDSDGTIASYAWSQTGGPSVTLTGADTATPSFTAPRVDGDTTLTFQLTVTDDDGDDGQDTVDVVVNDRYEWNPEVAITDPADGATIDTDNALGVSGDFDPAVRTELDASAASRGLNFGIGWENPGSGGSGDYVYVDTPEGGTLVSGATTLTGRAGNSDTDPNDTDGDGVPNNEDDCPTVPGPASNNGCPTDDGYDFGAPQSTDLRPGDLSEVCTLNFIYEYDGRYFFGSAAHCAANGSNTDTNGCTTPAHAIGSSQTISGRRTATITGTLAYSSWGTMQANGESSDDACAGNDFALFEIDRADLDKVHPAVRMYGGPTGLGDITDYSNGDDIRGYGRSLLHDDTIVMNEESSLTNPKNGIFQYADNGGWTYHVYLLPQGVPGDSGGGIMDTEGNALGAASTITTLAWDLRDTNNPKVGLPGSNAYTNIAKALEYMEEKEGWAPELVTWDDFDADPRVSMVAGSSAMSDLFDNAVSTVSSWVGGLTDLSKISADEGSGDGILPGSDIGHLSIENDDGTAFDVVLELNDGVTPSASTALRAQYEVSFTLQSTGVEYQLRAQNDVVAGWGYQLWVPSQDGGFTCRLTGHTITGESNNDAIRFNVDYADLNVAALPTVTGTTCNAATLGASAAAGDTLQSITGRSIHIIGIVNFGGELGDASDAPGTYTLGSSCTTCDAQVTFTVNGEDAGSSDVTDGAWSHGIDFDAFAPDAGGNYVVVASFGTATETVTYSGSNGDPCQNVAGKVVVTLADHTGCTEYDSTSAGTWNVDLGDVSDLAPGAYTMTATAHDVVGSVLDSHSITVHVPKPDTDGDGVTDDEDNCVDVFNPDQANQDGDQWGDVCDDDRDGDGVDNGQDVFPDDATEWSDLDGDGIGDNSDPDRDGDGVDNGQDVFPDDATEWSDLDGDGIGDNADDDRDGDGFSNDEEIAAGTDPDDASSYPTDDEDTHGGNMGNGDGQGADCLKFEGKENGNVPAMCRD